MNPNHGRCALCIEQGVALAGKDIGQPVEIGTPCDENCGIEDLKDAQEALKGALGDIHPEQLLE